MVQPGVPTTEVWGATANNAAPDIRAQAEEFEAAGYDGCYMSDSQNIRMECWVALTVAALSTSRIKIGSFITNPLTRHVAVTAAAAATLQEVSGGRVVLGVGRGDSALANIGHGPTTIGDFERFLNRLQAYLSGGQQAMEEISQDGVTAVSALGYARVPTHSRIAWLPTDQPKVPVNVVASGKRVLALGATLADEVTLVLGADLTMILTAMADLRHARAAAGRDPDSLAISAMIPVAVDHDEDAARARAARSVGEVGRWMSLQGGQPGGLDPESASSYQDVVRGYDMTHHGPSDSTQTPAITTVLSRSTVDRHSVSGRPDDVVAALRPYLNIGLKRLVVAHSPLFAREVLPELKA